MFLFFLGLNSKSTAVFTPVGGNITLNVSGSATAGIKFLSNGQLQTDENASYSYERDWLSPITGMTASDWEVQCETASGSGITLNNEDDGYHSLTSGWTFEDVSINGFHAVSWTFTVREVSNTSNNVSFTFTVNSEL